MNLKKRISALFMSLTLVLSCLIVCATPNTAYAAQKLELKSSSITLPVGEKYQLKLNKDSSKARWFSSNSKVAAVSKNGKVTAKKKGNCKITAKVNNTKVTCAVKVSKVFGSTINSKITISDNTKFSIWYTDDKDITCEVSDDSVLDFKWGKAWDKNKAEITLIPLSDGKCTVSIYDDVSKEKIKFTVVVKSKEPAIDLDKIQIKPRHISYGADDNSGLTLDITNNSNATVDVSKYTRINDYACQLLKISDDTNLKNGNKGTYKFIFNRYKYGKTMYIDRESEGDIFLDVNGVSYVFYYNADGVVSYEKR